MHCSGSGGCATPASLAMVVARARASASALDRACCCPLALVALAYVLVRGAHGEHGAPRDDGASSSRIPALLVTADVARARGAHLAQRHAAAMRRASSSARCSSCSSPSSTSARTLGIYAAVLAALAYLIDRARRCRRTWPAPRPTLRARRVHASALFGLVERRAHHRLRKLPRAHEPAAALLQARRGRRPHAGVRARRRQAAGRSHAARAQLRRDARAARRADRHAIRSRAASTAARSRRGCARSGARPSGAATTVAVLAIDLDHFKEINDTHGHPFGDVVLQELAGIMKDDRARHRRGRAARRRRVRRSCCRTPDGRAR